MDPFTWMSLIGGGASLLGNWFGGDEVMPEQINPLTDQYYQQVLQELNGWNQQQAGAAQSAEQARSRVEGEANTARQIRDQQSMVARPGANDWFYDFMEEQLPGYRAEAAKVAEAATRGGMAAQRDRAQQLSEQAARNAAAQFGGRGMFSGAANKAVAEGAANPLAQYEAELGNNYQGAFMGAYQPLSSQGQQLAYRGQQDAFNNSMNQLGQMLNSTQVAGNLYGQSMNGAQNLANMYGSRAQGAEAWRNDVAQPFYATPSYKPNGLATFGQGLSNLGMLGSAFSNNPLGANSSGADTNYTRDQVSLAENAYNGSGASGEWVY